jgi:hypothetical protein
MVRMISSDLGVKRDYEIPENNEINEKIRFSFISLFSGIS